MSVDIIIVTYNQNKYIRQAIDSVLMQQLNDSITCRIVVADDCSQDDTVAIIYDCLNGCQWDVIYLPTEKNLGHCLNYKRAFAACKAEYVAILEGDDYWCNPHHLQRHLDFLEEHRECVLSSNDPFLFYDDQHKFELWSQSQMKSEMRYYGTDDIIFCNKVNGLSTCVIRMEAIAKLPASVYETSILDWPLYICLSEYGFLCVHNEGTSVYRVQSNGIWSGSCEDEKKVLELKMLDEAERLLNRHHEAFIRARQFIIGPKKKKKIKGLMRKLLGL